jgi:metal-responsive CopG/Arc/MetJ family transcriptional regulator
MISSYDIAGMRTIVDLPKKAIDALAEVCRREKISRAEAIRRAVAVYLRQHRPPEVSDEAFGVWQGRAKDGREYEEKLREDWQGLPSL